VDLSPSEYSADRVFWLRPASDTSYGTETILNSNNGLEERTEDGRRKEKKDGDADSIEFNPDYRFYLAFSSLAVLAMMVALDGTAVSVALPVRLPSLNSALHQELN
jgi:hypothetical protein